MSASWPLTKLGDIISLEYGKPLLKEDRDPEGAFPVYGANGEKARSNKYYHSNPTIIVGRKGSAGELNLTEGKFWPLDVTYFVTFDEEKYELKFLFYLLKTLNLPSMAKGVKPGINRNDVYALEVRIPPKEEQQRIVSILDEVFAKITASKNKVTKKKKYPTGMIQSLLSSIFDGKMGWTTMALEDCAKFIDYRGRTPKKTESGLRLITAKNAKMGYLQVEPREFVSPESYDAWMTRGIPLKGDVIFTTEAPLGNVCQLDTDEKVVFAQRIITLQTNREMLNPSFLKYLLMSPQMQSIIRKQATGATVSGIKAKLLKKIEISFPSIQEQGKIVQQMDIFTESINKIEQNHQQELNLIYQMEQSILQEAFNGNL